MLIIFPVIIYPVILLYTAEIGISKQQKLEKAKSIVAIKNEKILPEMEELLKNEPQIKLVPFKDENISEKCNLVIVINDNKGFFATDLNNYSVTLFFESTNQRSMVALQRVNSLLSDYKQELVYRRLDDKKLSSDFLEPITVTSVNKATAKKITGSQLGEILPFLLIMFILTGTIQVAVDITAGEKERKTIQTLLLTPITRTEILLAKLAVVTTSAIISTTINFTSIALTLSFLSSHSNALNNLSLSADTFLSCLVIILPLVTLMSTLLLCLGIMAKNQIEASIYTMPVILLTFIPLLATSGDTNNNIYMQLIPVINTSLALKSILMGSHTFLSLSVAFMANAIYSVILLLATGKLFQNEDIAFGGISEIITQRKNNKEITVIDSIIVFSVSLLLYVHIGSKLQENNLKTGLVYSQILFLFLPALIAGSKASLKKVFRLNKPPLYSMIIAPLIGFAAIIASSFIGSIQSAFLPIPDSLTKALGNLVTFQTFNEGIIVILVVALTPAIFEEIFFRGFIMSGLEKYIKGFWLCLITGLLFAVFHLNVYHLLALTFTGTILGAWTLKSKSIIPAMIIHFTYNATQTILSNAKVFNSEFPWYVPAISFIFLLATLFIPDGKQPAAKQN